MAQSRSVVVLDPGHGGTQRAGGSSPNRASGRNGLLEKDLVLDLTRRVQTLLAGRAEVVLTRGADENLTLQARAAVARDRGAALFVSLHLNGSSDPGAAGTTVYVARGANPASRRLAERMLARVAAVTGGPARGIVERDLGSIAASRHHAGTGSCLVEMLFLTNPQQAERLATEDYRMKLAEALAGAITESLADSAGAPGVGMAAVLSGGGPTTLDARVRTVLDYIKSQARAAAGRTRTTPAGSRFARVLDSRYLTGYLGAPSAATATAAITAIGRQNRTGAVTRPCHGDDPWEAMTPALNAWGIPAGAERFPGLEWLAGARIEGAATDILTVANRREIAFIDAPFLLGRRTFDPLDCAARMSSAMDPDLQANNGINESQLMHWATGVKYAHVGRDHMRELFVLYEMWHLELFDVFGHDPLNDLIAEEAGRYLADEIRGLRLTRANYINVIDRSFRQGRAWVGALLRLRQGALDAQITADTPPPSRLHWRREIAPSNPDHPFMLPSIRQLLARGDAVSAVQATRLVSDYIEVYTLICEAQAWEAVNGAIPITSLQRRAVTGELDSVFRALPEDGSGAISTPISIARSIVTGEPTAARQLGAVEIAGLGWEVLSGILQNEGDITWQLQRMEGAKYPRDDEGRFKNSGVWAEKRFNVEQYVTHAVVDRLSAKFEVRFRYNGNGVGFVSIEQVDLNDAIVGGIDVRASIMPDPNSYTRGTRTDLAAVDLTFNFRFWHTVRTDWIYIAEYRLFGDGVVETKRAEWTSKD